MPFKKINVSEIVKEKCNEDFEFKEKWDKREEQGWTITEDESEKDKNEQLK